MFKWTGSKVIPGIWPILITQMSPDFGMTCSAFLLVLWLLQMFLLHSVRGGSFVLSLLYFLFLINRDLPPGTLYTSISIILITNSNILSFYLIKTFSVFFLVCFFLSRPFLFWKHLRVMVVFISHHFLSWAGEGPCSVFFDFTKCLWRYQARTQLPEPAARCWF